MPEEKSVERSPKVPYFGIAMAVIAAVVVIFVLVMVFSPKANTPVPDLYASGTSGAAVPAQPVPETPTAPPTPTAPVAKKEPKVSPPTDAEVAAAKAKGTQHATIQTDKGDIEVELDGADTPLTVANFVKLAKVKFYDGLTFHRVMNEKGFQIIQGGDPEGTGMGGPGYSIKFEQNPVIKHDMGVIAMARSQSLDSAGCQFYITLCPIPQLDDPKSPYCVFGRVIKGLDNAKKIVQGDKMLKVTVP